MKTDWRTPLEMESVVPKVPIYSTPLPAFKMSTNPETTICPITMEPEDHECPECGHMIAESIFNEICESEGYTNNCRHCQAKEDE